MTTKTPPPAGRTYSDEEIDRTVADATQYGWVITSQMEGEDKLLIIIRQLRTALDVERQENVELRKRLDTAQALSPWHDEQTAAQVVVATSLLDVPTAGEESRAFWGED